MKMVIVIMMGFLTGCATHYEMGRLKERVDSIELRTKKTELELLSHKQDIDMHPEGVISRRQSK